MLNFWGCSDDCIELDGHLEEEIYGESAELVLPDGFVASIKYNGDWKIQVLNSNSNPLWKIFPAGSPEAVEHTGRDYTDLLVVYADPEWAVLGKKVAK